MQKKQLLFLLHLLSVAGEIFKPCYIVGTKPICAGRTKIEISDVTKTIVDCLNDPAMAGGIRLTYDFLRNYFHSKEKNIRLLVDYAEKMHSSAVYKRLGYLLELGFPEEKELLALCKKKIKQGYS
ncbi:MAG: hypothetical protein M1561_04360 [Gammaproteobacteria bacterium]|nr:hypothetical protein [Gammaproteobacteria bacterium]